MSIKPSQWTKKPVTIEAFRYTRGTHTKREWLEWCPAANIGTPVTDRVNDPEGMESTDFRWFNINTLEGTSYEVKPGVWVIKGVKGEFYPCQPDIFMETYQAAE
jgi:hypothetical protein